MPSDGNLDLYLTHAAICLSRAQKTDALENRLSLLDMARAWLALADLSEKSRQTALVSETPTRSSEDPSDRCVGQPGTPEKK